MARSRQRTPRSETSRYAGFSLIEVLVALTIIALALGAIISSSGTQASQTAYLKQKTLAHWLAQNEITRLQISDEWPDLGERDGQTEFANHTWYWTRSVDKTPDENSRQVAYTVYLDEGRERNLTRLVAFVIKQ